MTATVELDNEDLLRSLDQFRDLDPPTLARVAAISEICQIPPGEILYSHGDDTRTEHFLIQGAIILRDLTHPDNVPFRNLVGPVRLPAPAELPAGFCACTEALSTVLKIDYHQASEILGTSLDVASKPNDRLIKTKVDWITRFLRSERFLQLPAATLQQILTRTDEIAAKAGEIIISQGDGPTDYYIVKSGVCKVSRLPEGHRFPVDLAKLYPGDCFGEEAIITGRPRNATVSMAQDGTLVRLPGDLFEELLVKPIVHHVDYNEALSLCRHGTFIDIRPALAYRRNGIAGSFNIPLGLLRQNIPRLNPDLTYVVVCDDDRSSIAAVYILVQHGLNAVALAGGILEVPATTERVNLPEFPLPDEPPAGDDGAPADPSATPAMTLTEVYGPDLQPATAAQIFDTPPTPNNPAEEPAQAQHETPYTPAVATPAANSAGVATAAGAISTSPIAEPTTDRPGEPPPPGHTAEFSGNHDALIRTSQAETDRGAPAPTAPTPEVTGAFEDLPGEVTPSVVPQPEQTDVSPALPAAGDHSPTTRADITSPPPGEAAGAPSPASTDDSAPDPQTEQLKALLAEQQAAVEAAEQAKRQALEEVERLKREAEKARQAEEELNRLKKETLLAKKEAEAHKQQLSQAMNAKQRAEANIEKYRSELELRTLEAQKLRLQAEQARLKMAQHYRDTDTAPHADDDPLWTTIVDVDTENLHHDGETDGELLASTGARRNTGWISDTYLWENVLGLKDDPEVEALFRSKTAKPSQRAAAQRPAQATPTPKEPSPRPDNKAVFTAQRRRTTPPPARNPAPPAAPSAGQDKKAQMQRFVSSGRHRGLGMQYTALALLVTAAALLGWVGPRAVYEHLRPYLAVDGRALVAWYQRQIMTWLPVSEPPPALPDSPAPHPRPTPATVTLVGESPRRLPDSPAPSPDRTRPRAHLPVPSPSARTVVAETALQPDIALPLGTDDLPPQTPR